MNPLTKPRTPKPSLEILTSRLVNELAADSQAISDEELAQLDEAKLLERYGGQKELPNVEACQSLEEKGEKRYQEIQGELKGLLEGEQAVEVDFTDPTSVKAYLDRFVEGQEEAKQIMSIAVVDYLQHKVRRGVLLLGPSGSGKTYMGEVLARALKITFVKKSLANVTSEGYKGQNLSEGLEDLLGKRQGILFLDEIDKINLKPGQVGGFEPKLQNELLAYLTGEKIKLTNTAPVIPEEENPAAPFPAGPIPGINPFEDVPGKLPQGKEELELPTPKAAMIYCAQSQFVVEDPFNNPLKKYLDSLVSYFREKDVPFQYRDLTSGFEEIPPAVTQILQKEQQQMARNRYRGMDGTLTLVVELDGEYLVNPKRADLDRVLEQAAKEEEPKKKADTPEKEKTGPEDEAPEDNLPENPAELKPLPQPTNVVDLKKILIITAGAFTGGKGYPSLYSTVQRRLGGNTCKLDETELLRNVEDGDLIEYGFKPEFVARLDSRAVLRPHGVDGLYRILKYSEDSPLDNIRRTFKEIGVELVLDDPALLLLAEYAHEGIGVRGIHKVLNELTQNISFNRKNYVGRTLVFTRSDLERRLKKQILWEKIDQYEVDWFNINSIIGYLDLFVPNQKEAKVEIARAFHLYHLRMSDKESDRELPVANLLLVGPSGSGKTYMISLLAKKAHLPVASTSAVGKVPEGYAGTQLADVFEQFSEKQKYGLVYLDEVDKVLLNIGDPLNNELIGMLEKGEVRGRKTDRYLFILSGAFQDIYLLKKEARERGIVGAENPNLTTQDLASFGVREELLGRIPLLANLDPPNLSTLQRVLEGPDSVITEYGNYFTTRGYNLELERGVAELICQNALKHNTGFRALKTVCGDLFAEYMVNFPQYVQPETGILKIKLEDATRILSAKEQNGMEERRVMEKGETSEHGADGTAYRGTREDLN